MGSRKPSLESATEENSAPFISKGEEFRAKVISVYDGDTCTIVIDKWGALIKTKCRLLGIDTPEMRPRRNIPHRKEHIRRAHMAKDVLASKILNKIVIVRCQGWDKYGGRILGELFLEEKPTDSICEWMVSQGVANRYFGGKKQS